MILTAAVAEPFHDYETPLLVVGAVLLVSAHVPRRRHTRIAFYYNKDQH